jgi:hypothetical protein
MFSPSTPAQYARPSFTGADSLRGRIDGGSDEEKSLNGDTDSDQSDSNKWEESQGEETDDDSEDTIDDDSFYGDEKGDSEESSDSEEDDDDDEEEEDEDEDDEDDDEYDGDAAGKQPDVLSDKEKEKATRIFYHLAPKVDVKVAPGTEITEENLEPMSEGLDFENFCVALALLGQTEKRERLKNEFDTMGQDLISLSEFMELLNSLRLKSDNRDINKSIREAFDAIYEATCPQDDQRDSTGRKFLTAHDLRRVMTNEGEHLP